MPLQPLRVLHIIPTLTGGGAENFVCALLPAFDRRRVDAAVMAIYPTRVPLAPDFPVIQVERQGRYDPGFLGRMLRGIRAFRPDIVHTHLHNGKYWGRLTAMAARVPIVVFTEHNPCGEKRILPEVLVDGIVNQFTGGIATFAQTQQSLLSRAEWLPAGKVVVIENGIALPEAPNDCLRARARRNLNVRDDDFAILVLARLIERKNQRLAIEALRLLRPDALRRARLFIIGAGEDATMLEKLIVSSGVQDRITLMGNREDAVELLYGGDVFFMPSLAEGMPLAMLEAMSVGLPVVTTPWIGVNATLRDGTLGTIMADWQPETAARHLQDMIEYPAPYAMIARRAMAIVRRDHDIARTARAHEEWYYDLARKRGLAVAS